MLCQKIDRPMSANRDKRELHIDNNFDSSTRLFIIVFARPLVRMDLLPLLHPFGYLHVMYARALPLGISTGIGTVIGLSCMPGSTCQTLGTSRPLTPPRDLYWRRKRTLSSVCVFSQCEAALSDSEFSTSCTRYARPSDVIQDSTSVPRNDEMLETATEFTFRTRRLPTY
jgi:hypothetical protein